MDKKKYDVSIADVEMSIISDEREEFVMRLVEKLDSEVRDILQHSKHSTKVDAALLLALDYSCGKAKAEKRVRNLEAQIALYDANLRRMREDNIKLRSALLGSKDAAEAQKLAEEEPLDVSFTDADGEPAAEKPTEEPVCAEKKEAEKSAPDFESASQLTIAADDEAAQAEPVKPAAEKSDREDKLRQFDRIADLLRKKDN